MSRLGRRALRLDNSTLRREIQETNQQLRQLAPVRRGALAASVRLPRARGGIVSGAFVVRSNGLPDGFEPPSTSLNLPGVTGEMAAARLAAALGGCQHEAAEPVELCTGEVVGAVCPSCWRSLPAAWVGSDWKP